MNWDNDAVDALKRTPVLLRGMVKHKVEGYVVSRGGGEVTLADVEGARRRAGRGSALSNDEYGGLQPEQIEKIVAETKNAMVSNSRFYEVTACGGAHGCPRALYGVEILARKIVERIETSGLPDVVASRIAGPVLRHHKLNVAIAGCLNSCSQPQIHDFGVQGRVRVDVTDSPCIECNACVDKCKEGSIAVEAGAVRIDRSLCIDCGDCEAVCPTGTLVREEVGYTILMGGKLGRHPQLARDILDFASVDDMLAVLDAAIDIFCNRMQPEERLADAVSRIGVEQIRSEIR